MTSEPSHGPFTVRDVANLLGVKPATARYWIADKLIHVTKLSDGSAQILGAELIRFPRTQL